MFICAVEGSEVISNEPSMTYAYYHANVKPKPEAKQKTGYVCRICGYVYEGEELPPDFVCPWCKHGAEAFEKAK
jgi:rubrerythrin